MVIPPEFRELIRLQVARLVLDRHADFLLLHRMSGPCHVDTVEAKRLLDEAAALSAEINGERIAA